MNTTDEKQPWLRRILLATLTGLVSGATRVLITLALHH